MRTKREIPPPKIHAIALKEAVSETKTLLLTPGIKASHIQDVYDFHFGKHAFKTSVVKSRPQFSEDIYPPLPINLLDAKSTNQIPKWNSAKDLLALATKDSSTLARILAVYIWKRGELGRVRYVREGILAAMAKATSSTGTHAGYGSDPLADEIDGPVVMWQFGRHIVSARNQPIFDQHTYRAYKILLRGVQSPTNPQLKLNHLNEYLDWWTNVATKYLPLEGSTDRPAAIYVLDKLLFSIGKAALLCPESYPRPIKKKRRPPTSLERSKRKKANGVSNETRRLLRS
jgi:hypothetical protein